MEGQFAARGTGVEDKQGCDRLPYRFRSDTIKHMAKDLDLSPFLNMPVADALDSADIALGLYRNSTGETKEQAKKILTTLRLRLSRSAPKTTSASRWKEIESQIAFELQ
jgi:hypothetical protein